MKLKAIVFSLLGVISLLHATAKNQPKFSTAGFHQLEGTGRQAYSMNIAWRFIKSDVANAETPGFDDSEWEVVSLPHGVEYLPLEASGGVNYQGPAWYRKHFTPDDQLKGKKLFLHFEAIMGKCKVWVNGQLASEHYGGYLPVIADVSNLLRFGEDNVIAVKADNSDDPLFPPGKPQNMLDFTYFGGIYRDCWLIAHNNAYITDANYENEIAGGGLFVSFDKVSEKSAIVNLKLHVRNDEKENFSGSVNFQLMDKNGNEVISTSDNLKIPTGKASYSIQQLNVKLPMLWSPDSPDLYHLNIRIKDKKGKIIDGYMQRIGIRSIEFKQKDGLWINGKPYNGKIMGTNRHQDFAVIGHALPNSMQWRDAKKLRDAGMEVIRTHYVIDPAFMDACDELGLFALVETPGWQFWNNTPIFGERVYSDIRNMIRQNRNHASLFFWEPILNETYYPKDFAKNAAEICEQEYPYPYSEAACDDGADGAEYFSLLLRPTRNLSPDKTYFVREWGDNVDDWNAQNSDSRTARGWGEVPMLVQARHYAEGYEYICSYSSQVVGGCFWHSFDHQRSHSDPFYGGMMDAFRQPKTSYYMFMSQRDTVKRDLIAETGPMVYIAHEMTPFSPKDVTVYSNCDEVRLTVFKDGKQYIEKKDSEDVAMPSPIIVFKDVFDFMACKRLARAKKQDDCYLLAEGLIKGKVVASYKQHPAERPDHIRLRLDNNGLDLIANGSDLVTVIAEVVDKRGTVKRLNNSSIKFNIEGEGRLIGDETIEANPRSISWGSAPILVQSTTKAGEIRITASILHEGIQRPVGGELIITSIEDTTPAIFSHKEADLIGKQTVQTVHTATPKSDLELENEKLRRELNELKIKEVEKQQTKFGEGIN